MFSVKFKIKDDRNSLPRSSLSSRSRRSSIGSTKSLKNDKKVRIITTTPTQDGNYQYGKIFYRLHKKS